MTTTGVFTFEEEGEEVTCRLSVSMQAYFDFLLAWNKQPMTIGEFQGLVARFVELAEPRWTGSAATFQDLDLKIVKATANAWLEAVPEVPLPLPLRSTGSEPSPEHETEPPAASSPRPSRSRGRRRSAT
jgi:hypothetical protein